MRRILKQPHNGLYTVEIDITDVDMPQHDADGLVLSLSMSIFHFETPYKAKLEARKVLKMLAKYLSDEADKIK